MELRYEGSRLDDYIDQVSDPKFYGFEIFDGKDGDDTYRLKKGMVYSSPGADVVLALGGYDVFVNYDGPAGVNIDLSLGLVKDSWGSFDRIVGNPNFGGTRFADVFVGNGGDNSFWPSGGSDFIDGGEGFDSISESLTSGESFFVSFDPSDRSWAYTQTSRPDEVYRLISVELLNLRNENGLWTSFFLTNDGRVYERKDPTPFDVPEARTHQDLFIDRLSSGDVAVTYIPTNETYVIDRNQFVAGSDWITGSKIELIRPEGTNGAFTHWFPQTFTDPDTNQELLIVSTIGYESGKYDGNVNSPPTPILVLKVVDGRLKDVTAEYFSATVETYWTRDLHVGDVNGDGLSDLFLSNQGREVDSFEIAPEDRVNPTWGEYNRLLLSQDGRWTEVSREGDLDIANFSHGSVMADIDGDETNEIIVTNLGSFGGLPSTYLLRWEDGRLVHQILPNVFSEEPSSWALGGDINGDGFDDVVRGWKVFWGGETFGESFSELPRTKYEALGFDNWHGGFIADLNHDGIPEIFKVSASNGAITTGLSSWAGSRFSYYEFKEGEFRDRSEDFGDYGLDPLGINFSVKDLDFDGHPDIVTLGGRYLFKSDTEALNNPENIYWFRNDGTGRFSLEALNLEFPATTSYFLADGKGGIDIAVPNYEIPFYEAQKIEPHSVSEIVGLFGAGNRNRQGFDSQFYLNEYPDVLTGVASGLYESAYHHFINFGKKQGYFPFAKHTAVWGSNTGDYLVLREGNEKFFGGGGNDRIAGLGGNDWIDGGDGIDQAFFGGTLTDHTVSKLSPGKWQVRDQRMFTQQVGADQGDGEDTLVNVERLSFSDQSLAFDFMPEESGYESVMLIGAAFGKAFVPAYFSVGLSLFDLGRDTAYVCDLIVGAGLIEAQIGDASDRAWVKHVYKNVVGVDPDPLTELVLIDFLASGQFTRSSLLATAAELPLLEAQVDITGLQTTGLAYTPFI